MMLYCLYLIYIILLLIIIIVDSHCLLVWVITVICCISVYKAKLRFKFFSSNICTGFNTANQKTVWFGKIAVPPIPITIKIPMFYNRCVSVPRKRFVKHRSCAVITGYFCIIICRRNYKPRRNWNLTLSLPRWLTVASVTLPSIFTHIYSTYNKKTTIRIWQ